MNTTITLDYPFSLADGTLVRAIDMRRPTLGDLLDCPVEDARDMKGESKLLALLCNMNIEDFRRVDASDYMKIQEAFLQFRIGNRKQA